MKNFINQPFHLTTFSPWPILISMNLMLLTMNIIKLFKLNNLMLSLLICFMNIILCTFFWWKNVSQEGSLQGYNSLMVSKGLKLGMILFIVSEVLFFMSFFWSYFHMFFSPSIEISSMWPPSNLKNNLINPYELPLFNTILLVSSGMFLSLAHYYILIKKSPNFMMIMTLMFGLTFTLIQLHEYYESSFSMYNSNYGSLFYMLTGFHGIHVIIGTIFIMITFTRMLKSKFSNLNHLGFEMSAWYWHFVDIVWLFLFLFIYWWPY